MTTKTIQEEEHLRYLLIKNCAQNNLKNVSLKIPQQELIVITGLSGSGKTSLAFETIYAEGQRRYVESLSAYMRQFMGKHKKPQVEFIKGLAPAIAIQQHVFSQNPRSTVGTTTEIYDYLRMLFANIGKIISPISGREVKKHTTADVIRFMESCNEGTKAQITAPVHKNPKRSWKEELEAILQKGFARLLIDEEPVQVNDLLEQLDTKGKKQATYAKLKKSELLVDRIKTGGEEENRERIADSVQTAFFEGKGVSFIYTIEDSGEQKKHEFNNKLEADSIEFLEPSVNLFTFNNPYGACPSCEGFGQSYGIEEDKVIPDKSLSIYDGAVAPWKGPKLGEWKEAFIQEAVHHDFPIHRPYNELTDQQKKLLWEGDVGVPGIQDFFRYCERKTYKIQYRVILARYKGRGKCYECNGGRLRKEANYVKVGGKSITELVELPIDELLEFFKNLEPDEHEQKAATRLLTEITTRLQLMVDTGLGYLTLNRGAGTLSGGESQRTRLVTSIGSNLTGALYVLDEPTIGLHPVDNHRLIKVLTRLRDLGNTVIVVEHDEEMIKAADHIIDMGPGAGENGGEVVFQGGFDELEKAQNSLTADYINGEKEIPLPQRRPLGNDFIKVKEAHRHNLKNIDVQFPIGLISVITGISGSGKSTLVNDVLYDSLRENPQKPESNLRYCSEISGIKGQIDNVEYVSQKPIGRSARSNPATYVKVFDQIREFFAKLPDSKMKGLQAKDFSFNVEGGRCEMCQGEGYIVEEMQFMADIHLLCEYCKGRRYKNDILEVQFREHSIADVLDLTVAEAIEIFQKPAPNISKGLQPLMDAGLDYIRLGQPATNLSGGEAQRIKLASFLQPGKASSNTLFIFDEPTTGLHFHDVRQLLKAFNKLIDNGHTILIIEHNPEVIKSADWMVDLGPGGGKHGGQLLYEGPPSGLLEVKQSSTGPYLRHKLEG